MAYCDQVDSGSDGEWEEASLEEVPCTCLFCTREDKGGASSILKHCSEEHKFDLLQFSRKLGLN